MVEVLVLFSVVSEPWQKSKQAGAVCVHVCAYVHGSKCPRAWVRVHTCVCACVSLFISISTSHAALPCEQPWRDPHGEDQRRLPPATRVSLQVHFPGPRLVQPQPTAY